MYLSESPDSSCSTFFEDLHVCFGMKTDVTLAAEGAPEPNILVHASSMDPWHLHFISHPRPIHHPYEYNRSKQTDSTVYILDTWIDVDHPEFGGRAKTGLVIATGATNGHGTHVAALVAGATVGVNPSAQIVSVQVLSDSGFGAWSNIIKGLEWVATQPFGIINLSISGPGSAIINKVIDRMSAEGWKIVVAAGNEAENACKYSPASSKSAITVGATTEKDHFALFSNYGKCVDLLAPGDSIYSAWPKRKYAISSGTSMSSPIVAGVWSLNPHYTRDYVVYNTSMAGLISYKRGATPNRLVYTYTGVHCMGSCSLGSNMCVW